MTNEEKILAEFNEIFLADKKEAETKVNNSINLVALDKLKEIYPELSKINFENKPLNLSFFDKKGNAVIILIVNNKLEFENLIEQMNKEKYFDKTKITQN